MSLTNPSVKCRHLHATNFNGQDAYPNGEQRCLDCDQMFTEPEPRLTVERALTELRKMWPEKLITMTIQVAEPITAYRVQIGYRGPDYEAGTLSEVMTRIRVKADPQRLTQ